jgi:hypothetical protein
MFTAVSTWFLVHSVSQKWGQILPVTEASGLFASITLAASFTLPIASRLFSSRILLPMGQAAMHGDTMG